MPRLPRPIVTRRHEIHLRASGHEHVTARHASTFEVTTDETLTPAGDCILAVGADLAPADFDQAFVAACRDEGALISMTIAVDGESTTIVGRGDPALTFASERSAVGRTSTYVDDRTIMLEADGAARDVERSLVETLALGIDVDVHLHVER